MNSPDKTAAISDAMLFAISLLIFVLLLIQSARIDKLEIRINALERNTPATLSKK